MLDIGLLEGALAVDYDAGRRRSSLQRKAEQAAEKGDYIIAAAAVEPLLKHGAVPLPVLGHYALGVLLEGGLSRLPAVLACISEVIGARVKEMSGEMPPGAQQKRIDMTLSGLFRVLLIQCRFHLEQRDETWQTWLGALDEDTVRAGIEGSRTLRDQLSALIEQPRCLQSLSRVEALLSQEVAALVASRPASAAASQPAVDQDEVTPQPALAESFPALPAAAPASDEGMPDAPLPYDDSMDQGAHADPSTPALPAPLSAAHAPHAGAGPDAGADPPGSAMYQLKHKLGAFQQLLEAGEVVKAAIIAKDIEQIRQSFDPVIYLPRLFAPYLQALCVHGDTLSMAGDNAHSLSGQALEQLYHADINAFLGYE